MKITVYTTTDCQFCKQEKDYLASKNVDFEEKNVQSNRDFLQEMLDVSNNFAGTPVTKIDKDDGQSVVLKGFTQSEFDNIIGAATQSANSTMPAPTDDQGNQQQGDQPVSDTPTNIPTEPLEPTPPIEPTIPEPATPEAPVEPAVPEPVVPETTPQPEPTTPEVPVETPVSEPSDPDPLPPIPVEDSQVPAQDDTVAEMHSTIPLDQPVQDPPVSDTPQPVSDQPVQDQPDPATPVEPTIPEPATPEAPVEPEVPQTSVETPPTATPEPQSDESVNQDQQLSQILDSLKTKADEGTVPTATIPDFPGTTQTS